MEHMPPLPPLRWRQNAHNTFLPETHEYIHCERSAMADGCHSPPMQKKTRCDLDCGVYVSQERAHTLTEATKGGELLRPSGCK
jgi:hypothetical protein